MKGQMYIYIEESHKNDVETLVTSSISAIKKGMDEGHFVENLLGITGVNFIGSRTSSDGDPDDNLAAAVSASSTHKDAEDDSVSVFGWLFSSAAVIVACAALATAFIIYRRRKNAPFGEEESFRENSWEVASYDMGSRVSFDQDAGRTRAVRFMEVNGQIIGHFDSDSFDNAEFSEADPASPSKRSSTMNVHKCKSATCEECTMNRKRPHFIQASKIS